MEDQVTEKQCWKVARDEKEICDRQREHEPVRYGEESASCDD